MTGKPTLTEKSQTANESPSGGLLEKIGVVAAYVACGVIWGTTWFAIRVCVSPEGYHPFMAAALRFTVAAVIFGALWLLGAFRIGYGNVCSLSWVGLACILSSVGFGLVYTAEKWISGGMSAIISSTSPLMMAVIATVTRTERVAKASVIGSLIALGGVLVIFQDCLKASSAQALALSMLLGSVAISAINNAILKRHTQEQNPLASAALFSIVSGLIFWIATSAIERQPMPWPPPVQPALAIVYLGVFGSVVAFISYFYLLKRVRLMTITTLVFYPPLLALAVDAMWEKNYTPSLTSYLGMVVTMAGVAVCLFGQRLVERFLR